MLLVMVVVFVVGCWFVLRCWLLLIVGGWWLVVVRLVVGCGCCCAMLNPCFRPTRIHPLSSQSSLLVVLRCWWLLDCWLVGGG